MPKLQSNKQRHFRYEVIARAEGEQCLICWMEDRVRRGPPRKKLIIEHADNDEKNWAWSNIHLVCYSHNKKLAQLPTERKKTLIRGYSDRLERERERENLPTWPSVLKELIPYDSGPPEMKANRRFEVKWLKYLHSLIVKYGSLSKREAIRRPAKKVSCSIQTSRNYLEKYTAEDEGPFQETIDDEGNEIITYLHPPSPGPAGKGKSR